ncbi:hypothetical protein [Traorella massiliensis]|uniref:hypothetical protein n=1 Tax=Traorella massiliensis TaxID=1903263 RepID=UPI0008F8CA8F|nr:hypothetical protein [Traorella massiliensis]
MNKLKIFFYTIPVFLVTPSFNEDEARNTFNEWFTPLTDFALWAIPITGMFVLLVSYIGWLGKDENEKEQRPFKKTGITILVTTIIVELIPTFFKIFGLVE